MKAFMGCSEEVKDLEDPPEEHHEIFLSVRVGGDLVGAWALWELAGPEGHGEITNFRGPSGARWTRTRWPACQLSGPEHYARSITR